MTKSHALTVRRAKANLASLRSGHIKYIEEALTHLELIACCLERADCAYGGIQPTVGELVTLEAILAEAKEFIALEIRHGRIR